MNGRMRYLNLQANGRLACNDKIVRLTGDVIVTNMNKLLKIYLLIRWMCNLWE